jgi:hypothetical protein
MDRETGTYFLHEILLSKSSIFASPDNIRVGQKTTLAELGLNDAEYQSFYIKKRKRCGLINGINTSYYVKRKLKVKQRTKLKVLQVAIYAIPH